MQCHLTKLSNRLVKAGSRYRGSGLVRRHKTALRYFTNQQKYIRPVTLPSLRVASSLQPFGIVSV